MKRKVSYSDKQVVCYCSIPDDTSLGESKKIFLQIKNKTLVKLIIIQHTYPMNFRALLCVFFTLSRICITFVWCIAEVRMPE